ncbi:MAG: lysylphosphatidylglycerol synthase transmembrane domain-containing protein, partial [Gaiellales bacterium]
VWLARALRISQGRALATVLVDRSSDVLVLVVAVVATYPFIPHPGWLQHVVLGAIAFGLLLMLVLGGARVWVSRRSGRGRPRPLIPRWFARQALALVHGLAAVSHADLVIVYSITVLSWMLWGVAAWLVAGSVGISLTPLDLVFITAVINLGAALPSSPGFIGTFQWLSVASLGLFGIGRTEAFAFSILMHAIWYVPTTVAGALIALRAGLSRRRRAASVMTGTSSAGPESDRVAYEAAVMERQV